MELKKQIILQIKNVYTANAFQTSSGGYIGAGSETEPQVLLYNLQTGESEELSDCPGGMMSFIPVPGQANQYASIMGLFPPFIGGEAGLYLHQKSAQGWTTQKAMSLPFAHRCEFITQDRKTFLLAASVSKYKDNPADWSRPGEVHVIGMDPPSSLPWESSVIEAGITRNHGMVKREVDGKEVLCISGLEGVFSIEPGKNQQWDVNPLFNKEVSEVNFIDLDGDGQSEMVTIEPFHGTTLNIYKKLGEKWELLFSDSLAFGHGLHGGIFNKEPVVVIGNRSESLALEMFTMGNLAKGMVHRKIIEEGVGPTQTQVFSFEGTDYIMSANQKKNEVALYQGVMD